VNSRKKRFADTDYYRGAMRWMGVGIEFCIVIGIFCLIGYFLDKKEGTAPGWMVLFFFMGFGFMLYTMIKRAKKDEDEERRAEEEREKNGL
jgi:F0F1-type ATP synthase assembly protein I